MIKTFTLALFCTAIMADTDTSPIISDTNVAAVASDTPSEIKTGLLRELCYYSCRPTKGELSNGIAHKKCVDKCWDNSFTDFDLLQYTCYYKCYYYKRLSYHGSTWAWNQCADDCWEEGLDTSGLLSKVCIHPCLPERKGGYVKGKYLSNGEKCEQSCPREKNPIDSYAMICYYMCHAVTSPGYVKGKRLSAGQKCWDYCQEDLTTNTLLLKSCYYACLMPNKRSMNKKSHSKRWMDTCWSECSRYFS